MSQIDSATNLAITLDVEQIQRGSTVFASPLTNVKLMADRSGSEISEEIGGCYLVRYLLQTQVSEFLSGSSKEHWVTPTPFKPSDLGSTSALFSPHKPRSYALILNPLEIKVIRGPSRVRLG